MQWFVYIILCSDGTLYTGISNNVFRRFREHCEKRGAKYFRGRSPKRLLYVESGHDRSSAAKREARIKKMDRNRKLQLVESALNSETPNQSDCRCFHKAETGF